MIRLCFGTEASKISARVDTSALLIEDVSIFQTVHP
jgi:hypothetical protein